MDQIADKKDNKAKEGILIRVTEAKRDELDDAARSEGISRQRLLERAIENELANVAANGKRRTKLDERGVQAYCFMQSAPTPMVIKDDRGMILWANLNYQLLVGAALNDLLGRTLEDLGILGWEKPAIESNIRHASGRPSKNGDWCLEPLYIRNDKLLFGTCRYVFRARARGPRYLGDVSFEWRRVRAGSRAMEPKLRERVRPGDVPRGTESLFALFLEQSPLAVAIKDADARLIYCNNAYATVLGEPVEGLLGRTTQEIFKLEAGHELIKAEESVRDNWWMYTKFDLPGVGPRVCLRFPIPMPDEGPTLVGVISTSIGSDEFPLVFTRRAAPKRNRA